MKNREKQKANFSSNFFPSMCKITLMFKVTCADFCSISTELVDRRPGMMQYRNNSILIQGATTPVFVCVWEHLLLVCTQHTCQPSCHHPVPLRRAAPSAALCWVSVTFPVSFVHLLCVWEFCSIVPVFNNSRNTTRQPVSPVYQACLPPAHSTPYQV